MVLKLNKILTLLLLTIGMNLFSQMRMIDINNKKLSINLKTEKKNVIKVIDNAGYSVFYIVDRKDFDVREESGSNATANIIFYSKKFNKGILVNFKQMIYHINKNNYKINLDVGSADNYMFTPSMIIVDKNFNYEYLMKYYYMNLPNDTNVYTSSISIQDNINRCNVIHKEIKGNLIYENIDDILSNISSMPKKNTSKKCDSIIYDIDLRDFFPKKIIK